MTRSRLSQEKDEFNFAFMLAHDLEIFPTLECINLTSQERLDVLNICIRLTHRGLVEPEDLIEIENLLGHNKATRLKRNAGNKARLETDFVNS